MNNYITAYLDELEYLLKKKIPYLYDDPSIKELYEKFYNIFPCDNESKLLEVAVLLYFNIGFVNKVHSFILNEYIFKGLSYEAVKFIVCNAKENYKKKIDQIKRFSVTPIQSLKIKNLKNFTEKCIIEIEKIEKNILLNENLKKKFKGEYQISKPIGSRSGRKSIREKLPKNITNKEKFEIITYYDSYVIELNRYYEVWEQIILEEYPDTVCIGKDAYLITTDIFKENKELTGLDFIKKEKLLIEAREKYSMKVNQYLSIPIKEIINCNFSIFVCTLGINYTNTFTGHANGLVFLLDEKKIYRLEPHGKDEYSDDIIKEELLINYTELREFEYYGTMKTCPYSPIGIQTIETLFNTVKVPKKKGYCFIWSLIFLSYVIHYNKDLTPDQIQNYLIHNVELNDLMYSFIIKLIKKYHQMIDQNYPFKNTETVTKKRINLSAINVVFDISTDDNIMLVYNLILRGTHFETIVYAFFDLGNFRFLNEELLNNIRKMLEVLENGTLYNKLKELDKENLIDDKFLPKTIYYYKDIIKNSFEEYIKKNMNFDKIGTNALKKLYFLFFELKICLLN